MDIEINMDNGAILLTTLLDGSDAQVDNASTSDDPLCMVFEWMGRDLRTVPSK